MIITITNPWTGAELEYDITDTTQARLDALAEVMDDDIREAVHQALAPCTAVEFLAEYVRRVGPDAAGRIILGG